MSRKIAQWSVILAIAGSDCRHAERVARTPTRSGSPSRAQAETNAATAAPSRLVILISIDQLSEHLFNFVAPDFCEGGFRRLMKGGVRLTEHVYETAMTNTAPGHAHLVTGRYPSEHGIVGNEWFDRTFGKTIQAHGDDRNPTSRYLRGDTVGDLLKKRSPRSHVISIGQKHRVAALMGGKLGEAVYYDQQAGRFRPTAETVGHDVAWLERVNRRWDLSSLAGKCWSERKASRYARPDDNAFERPPPGFSNRLPWCLPKDGHDPHIASLFKYTPWLVQQTFDLAKEAIGSFNLAGDSVPDLLMIGVASLDLIGHVMDPYSNEAHEMLLQIDSALADFLTFLEKTMGRDNVTILLTSDHGAPPSPAWLSTREKDREEAGVIVESDLMNRMRPIVPPPLKIVGFRSQFFFVKRSAEAYDDEKLAVVEANACGVVTKVKGVVACYTRSDFLKKKFPSTELGKFLERDFDPDRTGNIILIPAPYHMIESSPEKIISNHGTHYDYDRHVALILWGNRVATRGLYKTRSSAASVAPSIAYLLGLDARTGFHADPFPLFGAIPPRPADSAGQPSAGTEAR